MIFGKYRVIDKLGEGGMAVVFLARFEAAGGLSKTCVVKAIHRQLIAEKEFRDAFYDEARIALSLNHGNLVQTFDFGDEDGTLFLVMEWCDAGDLDDLMTALARRGERLSTEASCHIMKGLLAGLHYAHEARDAFDRPLELVHRDISPPNILLTHAGEIKLSDFGIARAAQRLVSTGFGVVKGKPAYLAPEQAVGKDATRQSDIFSAGIVFWEMIVGRRLFGGGDTRRIMGNVAAANITRPDKYRKDLPPRLNAVIMRALSPKAENRFESASAFLEEIESFCVDEGYSQTHADFAKLLDLAFHKKRSDIAETRMKTPVITHESAGTDAASKSERLPRRRGFLYLSAVVALMLVSFICGRHFSPRGNAPHDAAPATHAVAANEDAARVIVQSGDPGALIVIGDRPFGFNPVEGPMPLSGKKKKKVRVSLPGMQSARANKILHAAETKTIENLRPKANSAPLPAAKNQRTAAGVDVMPGSRLLLLSGLYRTVGEGGEIEYIRIP